MRVLHIQSGDLSGGAGRGAYWLHRSLLDEHMNSHFLVLRGKYPYDTTVSVYEDSRKHKFFSFFKRFMDRIPFLFYPHRTTPFFSTGYFGTDITDHCEYKKADIIHLHWINQGFISLHGLSRIRKPVVWTMRDMWPFTGGCHYSLQCTNYRSHCGRCPQLSSGHFKDLSYRIQNRKIKKIPAQTTFVAISPWLYEEAKKSPVIRNRDVRCIANGVSSSEFFPVNKAFSREALDLSADSKIILTGAEDLQHSYKGFQYFLEMLNTLDRTKYFLLFFGDLDENPVKLSGFAYKSLGKLRDAVSLRLVYNAADVFVSPSIQEAFGKTTAEAMLCGTPTVCFRNTGTECMIEHGVNGYLADGFEAEKLSEGVEFIINAENYDQISRNARENIQDNFTSTKSARSYIDLYREILASENGKSY
jgi:glycosyltransferase involved in cell wall biosynthesis